MKCSVKAALVTAAVVIMLLLAALIFAQVEQSESGSGAESGRPHGCPEDSHALDESEVRIAAIASVAPAAAVSGRGKVTPTAPKELNCAQSRPSADGDKTSLLLDGKEAQPKERTGLECAMRRSR